MMEKNELLHILRKYQVDSNMLNDALAEEMLVHIKNGMPAEQAINKVLSGDVYFPALLPLMMSSIVSAACLGYGIKNPSKSQQAAVEDILKNEPWASDGLSFNDRLPAMKKNMRQTIKSSIDGIKSKIKRIKQSVKEMLGFLRIPKKAQQEIWDVSKPDILDKAKRLGYEIVDEKIRKPEKASKEKDLSISSQIEQPIELKKLPEVKKSGKEKPRYIEPLPAPKDLAHELPGYLRRLELAARGLSGGNPQFLATYQAALKAAQKEIEKFIERSKRGTPNQILKGDYDLLIRSAQELARKSNQYAWDSLNRQVEYAIKRRAAYFAERITRSEAARAWFDGFIAQYQDDENVIAYRWKLSSRHHLLPYDQCDVCANIDVGLGKGVYPKNKLPSIPRHPHCMCMLVQIYADEVDKDAVFNPDKAREYIDSLKKDDQIALFGRDGLEKYQQGGNWESLMRGWDGFREPKSRLNKEDFKQDAILPNHEKSMISRDKIFKYALDANSPRGKDKAVVFESALGYNQSNGDHLIKSIMGQLKNFARTDRPSDKYGDRYNVVMALKGPNGKTANVLTAWMVRKGEDFPRLTTLYVTDKEASKIGDT